MIKWMSGFTKNHKGLSLVELICAVAILSMIITGVGTSMVVSARSYQRSNVELDLQQQAQITANLLTNLIIDAEQIEILDEGKTVKIVKAGDIYEIQLGSGNKLEYTENGSAPMMLAEHIESFSIEQKLDTNDYEFNLTVEGADGKTFSGRYHVTPRNEVPSGSISVPAGIRATIFAENSIVLEPNEIYDLNVNVANAQTSADPAAYPFRIKAIDGRSDETGTTVEIKDKNTITIKLSQNETGTGSGDAASFHIILEADNADDLPVEVLVRRVKDINVQGQKLEGARAKAGAVYHVTAQTVGSNLPRVPGAWYDLAYKPTHPVTWELRGEGTANPVESYAVIESFSEDASVPFCKVKLLQDIPQGGTVKVVAIAKHPEGTVGADRTNKTGLPYGTVFGVYEIKNAAQINRGQSADKMPFTFNVGNLGHHHEILEALYSQKFGENWSSTTNQEYLRMKAIWDAKSDEEKLAPETMRNMINDENPTTYAEYRYVMDEEKADESKWSPWIPLFEYSGGTPIFRPEETVYFRPDKDYVLQARVSLVKTGDNSVVYWPLEDTPQDQYITEYFVSKVSISDIWFSWSTWWPTHEEYSTKGTNVVPSIPKDTMFYAHVGEVLGYNDQDSGEKTYVIVERETSPGVWEDVTSSFEGFNGNGHRGGDCVVEYQNVRTSTPGRYRVMFYMQEIPYKENIGAAEVKVRCDLYNKSTGEGIFYFNITD